jgi:MFS family permease
MATTSATEGAAAPRLARLTRGFRALRVRNYRIYWLTQIVSLTGSWMQTTAQAWLVLTLTRSALDIGLVTTLQFLPVMLLSLFGGLIADRFSKHRLILATQTAALVQATVFGLLVRSGAIQLWHVYVLAAVQGVITAVDNPTRQAFVMEIVGPEDRINAVGLNSMQFNLARLLGPALAGLLIAQVGVAPALLLNAASFVPVIGGLLLMNRNELHPTPPAPGGSVRARLAEGLAYAWRTPEVLLILATVAVIGTFGFNFTIIIPLLGGFVLHTDAAQFGALSAFVGAGALAAATATSFARAITLRRLLLASLAFGLLFAVLGLIPIYAVAAALLVALGFAGITFATTANSLLQITVPDQLRGRVTSLYILLFVGSTPVGSFLIGALSSAFGVPLAFLICGLLCLLGVGAALVYRARTA